MSSLLIGAVDNYSWSQIKLWAKSIRETTFDGDVVLIAYRLINRDEILENCKQLNITVIEAAHDNWGQPIIHNQRGRDTVCHQMRFFHIWQYLKSQKKYEWVIITDVRDVVFQKNPLIYFNSPKTYNANVVAATEGIKYKDEPWGADNLLRGFGPYVFDSFKDDKILNVGTIALKGNMAADIALQIFSMGENRYIPNDQSSWNVFVYGTLLKAMPHGVSFGTAETGWACQVGTFGDPTKPELQRKLVENLPVVKDDGIYTHEGSDQFVMVHQYDRNPIYNELFTKRFA